MKGPFFTYQEALKAAKPGEEIWARNASQSTDRTGWCVMSNAEAVEYIRTDYVKEWIHWESIYAPPIQSSC